MKPTMGFCIVFVFLLFELGVDPYNWLLFLGSMITIPLYFCAIMTVVAVPVVLWHRLHGRHISIFRRW